MINVKIDGLDELVRKYGKSIERGIEDGVVAVATEIENKMKPYPPMTAGNTPKTYTKGSWNTWYQRGYGSKWVLKSGQVRGRATSQTLGRRWQNAALGRLGRIISNNASYAGYVQGERQTGIHARHGWMKDKKLVDQMTASGRIKQIIEHYVYKLIR